jgi:hypothetical protein
VSSLKLRASYGELGNQSLADYSYIPVINLNQNYVVGTDQHLWNGAIQTSVVNSNIKWESTKTSDVGLDVGLLNNKINFTADYYSKTTSDILVGVPLPPSVGSADNPVANAGEIRNRGLELSISYAGGQEFTYNIYGTFSSNKNHVLSLAGGRPLLGGSGAVRNGGAVTTTKVGGSVGAFYLIHTDGIFNSEEEVQSYKGKDGNLIQPNAGPGDIRFVDANGDGIISDADKLYSGSAFPKCSYGFGFNGSWKGFDLSVYIQGTYGNKIFNGVNQTLSEISGEHNWLKSYLNAWTADHHTDVPRVITSNPNGNNQISDYFLENGSYLRMKTLQLGYTFNSGIIEKAGITSLRTYLSFDNIFTITKYSGYNPDIGRTGSILNRGVDASLDGFPLSRSVSLGVHLGL